jgi:hypothetical protein
MPSWTDFHAAAPEFATALGDRFRASGLAFLATLRRDGSPRISGIEVKFLGDDLWLGMMPGSRKSADLARDPRLALHAASSDAQVTDGDAKLAGRAVRVSEGRAWQEYAALAREHLGTTPEPATPAFRVDVREASLLRVAGDHLVIEWWRPGEGVRRVERR